jgi:hypothetical protein
VEPSLGPSRFIMALESFFGLGTALLREAGCGDLIKIQAMSSDDRQSWRGVGL